MGLNKFQDVTTILFDLDNTLINTRVADISACEQVCQYLQEQGVRASSAQASCDRFRTSLHDPDHLTQWREALGPGLSGHASAANALWREARLARLRLVPGLEPLLAELRGRYKLGIVTSGPAESQWEKIRRVGVAKFFDAIVVSGVDVAQKASCDEAFEDAFQRLDASRQEVAAVGGRAHMAGAARAGVAVSVWVMAGSEGDPLPADFQLPLAADLLRLLPEQRPGFTSRCRDRALEVLRDDAYRVA